MSPACAYIQVDDEALLNLVATLRLPIQIGKGSLPRLFLNLTLQPATRAALLRILLALLRLPLSTSGDGEAPGAGSGSSSSMAIDDADAGAHSLEEALQVARPLRQTVAHHPHVAHAVLRLW